MDVGVNEGCIVGLYTGCNVGNFVGFRDGGNVPAIGAADVTT